ncbi:unnamed protein product [Dibothriocephalus latus]|uniref:Uncharacterized protein n=1 Tax=Dibothriocephalus latus TaxID=60516 RepID=A0A3P6SSC3_DIBLA|nr:unnamed protein product [Dibothriocephalus latus]
MQIELCRVQRERNDGRLDCRDRYSALGEDVFDTSFEFREKPRSLIKVMVPAEERNIGRVRYQLCRGPGDWGLSHVDVEECRTEHGAFRTAASLLARLRGNPGK